MTSLIKFAFILLPTCFLYSQTTPPSTRAAGRCVACTPDAGYNILSGTPDMSDAIKAADLGTTGGGTDWTSVNPIPTPPTGHSEWITLRDLGPYDNGYGVEEVLEMTVTSLTTGCIYVTHVYSNSSLSLYADHYIDEFAYTAQGEPLVTVGPITQDDWGLSDIFYEAFGTTSVIEFSPGSNANTEMGENFESVNLSIADTDAANSPTLSADSIFFCGGGSVNLDNLVTSTALHNSSIVWSTDGDKSDGVTNIIANTTNISTSGTYYAYYYYPDIDAYTCSPSSVIIVSGFPTATITGSTDICQDETGHVLTFVGGNGLAPYTFTYTDNGGTNQTVTSVGDTTTVIIPTNNVGTLTYSLVSVQDASNGACMQAQSGVVTVNVSGASTATISGTITVCEGDASPVVTLTGTNGTAPYTFTYNIDGGANQTVVSSGNTATLTVSTGVTGVFEYNLISIVDASGTNCIPDQTGTATITVNPLVNATIDGNAIVCEGDASPVVTFVGQNGTAPYIFTYTDNGGTNQTITSIGDTAMINVPTINAGSYNYTLISVQDANSTACSQQQNGMVTVTVNPLLMATIGGTATVCQGDVSPVVTFTGTNGTAPYLFTYTINGGTAQTITSTGNTATINSPTNQSGTYEYVLINIQDASAMACAQNLTATTTIIVNPLPTAAISGTATVCEGDQAPVVTLTGMNGVAPYMFTYSLNGGANQTIMSTGNTASVNTSTNISGTFSYELISVENAGSSNCSQTQTGTVILTVNPLPNVFAGDDVIICEGEQVTLSGSGADMYSWNHNVMDNVSFTPDNSTLFSLIGIDDNGCTNTDEVLVTVEPLPSVSFVGDVLFGCSPLAVQFTNTTSGDNIEYTWTIDDATTLMGENVSYIFDHAGLYDVMLTVTSANGCTNSVAYTDYIYVEAYPEASLNPSNLQLNSLDSEVFFENTSTGATYYQWDFGDGSQPSIEESPSHDFSYDENMSFVVELIAYSMLGCSDTAWVTIKTNEELIFYVPNAFTPDGDEFNQTFKPIFKSGYDPMDYKLLVFDRWGQIIFESNDSSIGWDGTYNGRIVQNGVYVWKIEFKSLFNDERKRVHGHVNLLQ